MSGCHGEGCPEVIELLTEYLEGDLPPTEQTALAGHFIDCPPCRDYLDHVRSLGPAARRAIAEEGIPEVVSTRLEEVLRKRCCPEQQKSDAAKQS